MKIDNRTASGRAEAGFTLVEIATVVMIIAIIAGTMLASAKYVQERAAKSKTLAMIHTVSVALESYKADWQVYPRDVIDGTTWNKIRAGQPADRKRAQPYGTGAPEPAESLWYYLSQAMPDLGKKTYINFKTDQLCDRDNDKILEVADGFGFPLNYKSNNPESYLFAVALKSYYAYQPRHNADSFDLCSYGRDGTTWKTYDPTPTKRTGTTFAPNEVNFSGSSSSRPGNYYYAPFNTLGQLSGNPYSFGGEGNDDLNNWQER